MILYSIRNWDQRYENNRSRKIKNIEWVMVPNDLNSEGYIEIMSHDNGMAIYSCWIILLSVASKCKQRGILRRSNGKPHDPASLAQLSRTKVPDWCAALQFLAHLGWLDSQPLDNTELAPRCAEGAPKVHQGCAEDCTEGKGREGKGIEGKGREDVAAAPSSLEEAAAEDSDLSCSGYLDFRERLIAINPDFKALSPDNVAKCLHDYQGADWDEVLAAIGKKETGAAVRKPSACLNTYLERSVRDQRPKGFQPRIGAQRITYSGWKDMIGQDVYLDKQGSYVYKDESKLKYSMIPWDMRELVKEEDYPE